MNLNKSFQKAERVLRSARLLLAHRKRILQTARNAVKKRTIGGEGRDDRHKRARTETHRDDEKNTDVTSSFATLPVSSVISSSSSSPLSSTSVASLSSAISLATSSSSSSATLISSTTSPTFAPVIAQSQQKERKEEKKGEEEQEEEEKEEEANMVMRVATRVEEGKNGIVFTANVVLPNACAICEEIFDDIHRQNAVGNRAATSSSLEIKTLTSEISETANSEAKSRDLDVNSVRDAENLHLMCDSETHRLFRADEASIREILSMPPERRAAFRRCCTNCFRRSILAQIEKTDAFIEFRDRDGVSTFQLACPLCIPRAKSALDTDILLRSFTVVFFLHESFILLLKNVYFVIEKR